MTGKLFFDYVEPERSIYLKKNCESFRGEENTSRTVKNILKKLMTAFNDVLITKYIN